MEKRYLVIIKEDVSDEGDVGLIKVFTEKEFSKVIKVRTGFGNLDGEIYDFNKVARYKEITEEEYEILKRLGLTNLEFGSCMTFNKEERQLWDIKFSDKNIEEEYDEEEEEEEEEEYTFCIGDVVALSYEDGWFSIYDRATIIEIKDDLCLCSVNGREFWEKSRDIYLVQRNSNANT